MRLIDADLLTEEIKSLRCTLIGLRAGKGILARAADEYQKSISQIIEDQPTAFDKEKVIDDLENLKNNLIDCNDLCGECLEIECDQCALKKAIEIVEKGGIE